MSTPQIKRRSNDEILQAMIAERKAPRKKRRRTKTQIERDNRLIAKAKHEKELAAINSVYVVTVVTDGQYILGADRKAGDEVWVQPDSYEYRVAFDANGNFILNKTPAEQLAEWNEIRYMVRKELR